MQHSHGITCPNTIARVRQIEPLVHCITATVSMELVANGLLATGARPAMTETLGEAPSITSIADALLINFGTLSSDSVEAIPESVAVAVQPISPGCWILQRLVWHRCVPNLPDSC